MDHSDETVHEQEIWSEYLKPCIRNHNIKAAQKHREGRKKPRLAWKSTQIWYLRDVGSFSVLEVTRTNPVVQKCAILDCSLCVFVAWARWNSGSVKFSRCQFSRLGLARGLRSRRSCAEQILSLMVNEKADYTLRYSAWWRKKKAHNVQEFFGCEVLGRVRWRLVSVVCCYHKLKMITL